MDAVGPMGRRLWRSVVAAGLALLEVATLPLLAADWSPRKAAEYLDRRQKLWFEWPPAAAPGGPCVSCHTGLTYLMARPALRKALGEQMKTPYERGLLAGLRGRLVSGEWMFKSTRQEAYSVEAVLGLLALSMDDEACREPRVMRAAWDRVWRVRGRGKQYVAWFNLSLRPWEVEESEYLGGVLVAVAAGRCAEGAGPLGALVDALRGGFARQPVHNKLMALWAAANLPGVVSQASLNALVRTIWRRQERDGGWPVAVLGPWRARVSVPMPGGSDAFATALIVFAFQHSGAGCGDPRLERARAWLRSHQDPESGAWRSQSMNKRYPPESLQAGFMDDAATGFAASALLDPGKCAAEQEKMAQ